MELLADSDGVSFRFFETSSPGPSDCGMRTAAESDEGDDEMEIEGGGSANEELETDEDDEMEVEWGGLDNEE